jgi:ketosteroid isomerase-like protein
MEAISDYGNEVAFVANIVEFRDGKIVRETRYYVSPFDAPEWRRQWVEPIS